ncbi:hypothetical protein C8Q74DRAFT_1299730 [Fomes fomentarius]|nr:hypothetical protein C8Q74DRAFT_1299730 [Fomes fomentarius]
MEGHGAQEGTAVDTGREKLRMLYPAPPCHRMSLACLRRHSATIQKLHLANLTFPTSMDYARLLLSFPALRSFECGGISVEKSQKIPDA